ncbi:MAG: hypothetical protein EOO15_21985, partial [Chitinophagaceae bacterium]
MRTSLLCLLAAMLLAACPAYAQEHILRGTVTDTEGNKVPFASISTTRRNVVSADANGNWAIRTTLPARIQISATGYESQTFKVSDSTKPVNATLSRSEAMLETVVVTTGLGIRRVRELPGYESSTGYSSSASLRGKSSGVASGVKGVSAPGGARGLQVSTAEESPVAAHQLTAGEVSDFKKWKLWGDYTDDDFKSVSAAWKMSFRKRYCMLVQNTEHQPLLNEPVYLVDGESGDTLWAARTDNTGKAELWADGFEGATSRLQLHCGGKQWPAFAFADGLSRAVLPFSCRAGRQVEVAFVVDATGSMSDEIRYLQAELGAVIRETRTAHPDIDLRAGAVFYRDHGDSYLTRFRALTSNNEGLLRFINEQSAGGGGDGPEAVEEALAVALDSLGWSADARSRLLFLVLDAPPHEEARARMAALARQAARKGVRIVPVVCSGADKSTEYLMRCLALATDGTYTFLTDDSGIGGGHIKPSTDEFKVELLAGLMKRLLDEMCYA